MRTRGSWRLIQAAVSGSVGAFRMAKATPVWSLRRGLSASQCQGSAKPAGEVCWATLERAEEDDELGLSVKEWWEVLQFADECNGLVSMILHACGDAIIGTDRVTGGNDPVGGMLDTMDARCP
jgi:hypothetical protein